MKRLVSSLLALTTGMALLAAVLALAEVFTREMWTPPWETKALGSIDPKVFAEYSEPKPVGQPFDGKYIKLNSHGFRHDTEFTFDKDPKTYRIVMIGGSVAFGSWASSRAKTVMGILEQCLHHPKKRVEVIGLGESGDEIADEIFWLFKLGLRLKPDLVVSLGGYNDLFYSALEPKLWDKGSGRSGYARPGVQSPLRENTFAAIQNAFAQLTVAIDRYLYRTLRFYQWLKYKAGLEEHTNVADGHAEHMNKIVFHSDTAKLTSQALVANYSYLQTLLDSLGIPLVIFFQPVNGCGEHGDASKFPRDSALCGVFRETLAVFDKLSVVDLSLRISDQLEAQKSFMDPVHLDDNGFDVLGKAMCKEIAARMAPQLTAK